MTNVFWLIKIVKRSDTLNGFQLVVCVIGFRFSGVAPESVYYLAFQKWYQAKQTPQ